jgi:hypothetical protein
MTNRQVTFGMAEIPQGFEVLLLINGQPRRMALCTHKDDAISILEALNYVKGKGEVWFATSRMDEPKQYTCAHCQGRGKAPLIHAVNWVMCEDCKGEGTVDQPPVQPSYEDLMGQAQEQLNRKR